MEGLSGNKSHRKTVLMGRLEGEPERKYLSRKLWNLLRLYDNKNTGLFDKKEQIKLGMTLVMEARETLLTSVEFNAAASDPRQAPQTLLFNNCDHPWDKPRKSIPRSNTAVKHSHGCSE